MIPAVRWMLLRWFKLSDQVAKTLDCFSSRHGVPLLCLTMALALSSVALAQTNPRFNSGASSSAPFEQPAFDQASEAEQPPAPAANSAASDPTTPDTAGITDVPEDATKSGTDGASELDAASTSQGLGGSAKAMIGVLRSAGLMAFPIAACSILLVMFALERAINLRRPRVIPKHFVKLFLSELEGGKLKPAEALELCEENGSPISEVFAAAVKKWNRPSVEVEQAVLDAGERVANSLRRYLRLFNGISTVSPLLGLLGTVLGMIQAFNAIAAKDAMGKPEVLASGISEALLTTAGGLSVAIPAFIIYMYFTSRVDRLIIEIDSLGQRAVFAIGSDAWKPNTKSKKAA